MTVDIRLMGLPENIDRLTDLLRAVEHLQATGEVLDVLHDVTIDIVSESNDRPNRGKDKRVRRYLQVDLRS